MENLLKYTGGLITKAFDGNEERLVSGYYTSATVDLHGHIIDKNAMTVALEDYRQWGTIREMHDNTIGKMKQIGYPEWNWLEANISRTQRGNEVMQLVSEGIYKAFSVGLMVTNWDVVTFASLMPEELNGVPLNMLEMFREHEYIFKITGLTLIEVSIVDRPANPLARMQEVQNAVGSNFKPLPSILSLSSKGDWESAVVGSKNMFNGVDIDAIVKTAEQMENQMPNEIEKEIDATDTAPVEDAVVEQVNTEDVAVEAEVETAEKAADTEGATDEATDTNDSDVTLMTKAVEQITLLVDAVKALAEKNVDADALAATIADAVASKLAAQTKSVEPVIEDDSALSEVSDETLSVAPEGEATEKTIVDATLDVASLAKQVATLVREQFAGETMERKGAVNGGGTDEQDDPAPVTVKQMKIDDLKHLIVKTAASKVR